MTVSVLPRATGAVAVTTAAAMLSALLYGCSGDAGAGSASRRARQFYAALNSEDFDAARSMLAGEPAVRSLVKRFGSLQAWADRVTKNGIVTHLHATETSADDTTATVEVLLMFHDGTRRTDELRLLRLSKGWQVQADSLVGNHGSHEP